MQDGAMALRSQKRDIAGRDAAPAPDERDVSGVQRGVHRLARDPHGLDQS
jgi:hypothetical protein